MVSADLKASSLPSYFKPVVEEMLNAFSVKLPHQASSTVTVAVTLSRRVEFLPPSIQPSGRYLNPDAIVITEPTGISSLVNFLVYAKLGAYWSVVIGS